ncbi:MAG: thermonuclease family protein [Patescibacteria group bacterium]|nr:thermonuclease family protein [Patescibacteria group bacterium]MDD5121143.1 thermonuclease family protein [Patescibacteria group bacterium]MDD5221658.1 thermonuclease family protein [Patescibacteria group bacterium]MDD5395938.1 thermonuclease family protein [Patescibacteria group bacterium]
MRKTLILSFGFLVILLFLSGCTISENNHNSQLTNISNGEAQETTTKTEETNNPSVQTNNSVPEIQLTNKLFKVIKVVDGDTIDVDLDGKTERLRLIGIDTPETVDPRKVVQCFGKEASDKAKEILNGKMVSLESDKTQGERDKYDRLLRYVYLEDGTMFNRYMIAEGYAHEYTYQSNPYKYQAEFKETEKQAREQNKGLWDINTCNGDTAQAADKDLSKINDVDQPQVKKSTTGICHEKGSTYYLRTTHFTPYNSIEECLNSGGRLPLR